MPLASGFAQVQGCLVSVFSKTMLGGFMNWQQQLRSAPKTACLDAPLTPLLPVLRCPPSLFPPSLDVQGVPNEIDFIAASFVRKGSDLDYIRQVLGPKGE